MLYNFQRLSFFWSFASEFSSFSSGCGMCTGWKRKQNSMIFAFQPFIFFFYLYLFFSFFLSVLFLFPSSQFIDKFLFVLSFFPFFLLFAFYQTERCQNESTMINLIWWEIRHIHKHFLFLKYSSSFLFLVFLFIFLLKRIYKHVLGIVE